MLRTMNQAMSTLLTAAVASIFGLLLVSSSLTVTSLVFVVGE